MERSGGTPRASSRRRGIITSSSKRITLPSHLKSGVLNLATMIIDGERATAASGETYEVRNPATGEVVDQVASGGPEDGGRAARAAGRAQKTWGRVAPAARARIPPAPAPP